MFLLMTDGAWHCQGTVGQACASSMPPAPLLCTPPHKLQHAHTASLSHLAYLSWTLPPPPPPPFVPPPPMRMSVSQSLFFFLFLTHWHDTTPPLPTVMMTVWWITVCGQISMTLAKCAGWIVSVVVLILLAVRTKMRVSWAPFKMNCFATHNPVLHPNERFQKKKERERRLPMFVTHFVSVIRWLSVIRSHSHFCRKQIPDQLMHDGDCVMIPFIFMEVVTGFWRWFAGLAQADSPPG